MKRLLFLLFFIPLFLPVSAQQSGYRGTYFRAKDSTVTGTPATGFVAIGKYKTLMYKPAGMLSNGPAINFDLRSIAGNFVEYMRMPTPAGTNVPPFSFVCTPTLNPDNSYNNVVSWGFNPFRILDAGKPAVSFIIEPHYIDGGLLTHEVHMPQVQLANGTILRLASSTFRNRGTDTLSDNTWHFRGENFEFATLLNQSYFAISGNRTGNTTNVSIITPNTGQGAVIGAATTGLSISPTGLSGVNSALNLNTFNQVVLPMARFKADDLGISYTGDQYGAPAYKSRDWGWVTGNNGNFKRVCATENINYGLPNWTGTAILSAIVKDGTNPSGLLFQLQKEDGATDILKVRNDGKIFFSVTEYADNAAALAGGLTTGMIYRTGDLLKIVH